MVDQPTWERPMREEDASRRSPFNPTKIVSNNPDKCGHVWLRFSGFDECKFCRSQS